jgi:type IV pilus assembly protein PilQ
LVVALGLPGLAAAQSAVGVPFPDTPVTLDLHDESVRGVLEELARLAGVNVLFGDGVDGVVSGTFTDAPMDEVVESLLESAQLGWCVEGGVLAVEAR